jgi:hypothetical protein
VVVKPSVGVLVVLLSTRAAAGIRIAKLLLPVSTTTFCPFLSSTQMSPTAPHAIEKVSLSLSMPPYFPWTTAPCIFA